MGVIHILDSELSNKIAAGEVVERPSSVVKELVENSIDAKSTNITVEIKNGGSTYIRVSDNGVGMSEDDAKICFLRHATSKVQTDEDLDAIYTLGFRGEALSSIGAVARVMLNTKRKDDVAGVCVKCEGGEIKSSEDTAAPTGTSITVEDLFFNTPARQKFLKKDATEAGYITDIMTRFILAHPEISFKYIVNGKEKLFSAGDSSMINAVYTVYGKDYARHMLEVNYSENGITVTGLAGTGNVSRPNRNYQSFFVNKRYIKSPMMIRAAEEAYKNQVMIGKYPVVILNVGLDPQLVDINVHPTKLEAKFSNERDIYRAVYYAVMNALYAAANVPEINRSEKREKDGVFKAPQREQLVINPQKNSDGAGGNPYSVAGMTHRPPTPEYNPHQNPFMARNTDNAESKVGLENPENKSIENMGNIPAPNTSSAYIPDAGDAYISNSDNSYIPSIRGTYVAEPQTERPPLIPDNNIASEKSGAADTCETHAAEDTKTVPKIDTAASDAEENVFENGSFRLVGQVFDTYIIAEQGDKMLLIDQHAAHERLKYEELKINIENKIPFSQILIEPVIVTVTAEEYEAYTSAEDELLKMGFDCGTFGDNTIIVRAVPGETGLGEVEDLITTLLDEAVSMKRQLITDTYQRLLYTIACKSAVKGNTRLTEAEMEELIRRVFAMKNINTCPHGRPIVITMSKRELEKEFGRIV